MEYKLVDSLFRQVCKLPLSDPGENEPRFDPSGTICFASHIHNSADIYGASRSLIRLLGRLDRSRFHPLVMLPQNEPLEGLSQPLDGARKRDRSKVSTRALGRVVRQDLPGAVLGQQIEGV